MVTPDPSDHAVASTGAAPSIAQAKPRDGGIYITGFVLLIVCGLLGWALDRDHKYAYYTLLRWIVCPTLALLAVNAVIRAWTPWAWMLGIGAVVYNPLARVHATREIWSVVNVMTIALIVGYSGFVLYKDRNRRTPQP